MNKVELKECTEEKIKKYKEIYNLKEILFNHGYDEVLIDGIPRALISYSEFNVFKEWKDVVSIEVFEVFEKGKGYGSIIIDAFKEYKIHIIPSETAINFWEKHGFKKFTGYEYINFDS